MISTKGRYAMRVMLDLAMQPQGTFVPLHDVAVRQNISEKYLEIIIKMLVKNRLVKGHRGKGGGYMLTRDPASYSAWEILCCTEENMVPVACMSEGAETCPRKAHCPTIGLWEGFDAVTHSYFEKISLADLISRTSQ